MDPQQAANVQKSYLHDFVWMNYKLPKQSEQPWRNNTLQVLLRNKFYYYLIYNYYNYFVFARFMDKYEYNNAVSTNIIY